MRINKVILLLFFYGFVYQAYGQRVIQEDQPSPPLPSPKKYYLNVDPQNIPVSNNTTRLYEIKISTNAGSWSLKEASKWCKNIQKEKRRLIFSCEDNPGMAPRNGTIKITTSAGSTETIAISQEGGHCTLSAAPHAINLSYSTESKKFEISTNSNTWRVRSKPSWGVIKNEDQKHFSFTFTCEENKETIARIGEILIDATGCKTDTIKVTQAGIPVFLSASIKDNDTLIFKSSGNLISSIEDNKKATIKIYTNAPSWKIESTPAWCKPKIDKETMILVCDKNKEKTARMGQLKIAGENKDEPLTINIIQEGTIPMLKLMGDALKDGGQKLKKSFKKSDNKVPKN